MVVAFAERFPRSKPHNVYDIRDSVYHRRYRDVDIYGDKRRPRPAPRLELDNGSKNVVALKTTHKISGLKERGDIMGMTDKQFAAYNRLILKRLKKLQKLLEETGNEELKEELLDIMEDIQKATEE